MHFITVDNYWNTQKPNKVYINIDAVSNVNLTPNDKGYYIVITSGGFVHVNQEDCQRILDEIQKYNR